METHLKVVGRSGSSVVVDAHDVGLTVRREPRLSSASLRAAWYLSWSIVVLTVAAAAAGLFVHGLYKEGAWAREALRGGDLVTLLVAAPLLIGALVLSARGSHRAQVVWMGMLAYAVYNYAYYVFGSAFNHVFLIHIAVLSMSVFALACALPTLAKDRIGESIRTERAARWMGVFLVAVGALQGALWVFVLVRNIATGELIKDIPVAGQHLVFALDLSLLVPTLILSGVLLFRREAMGFLLGAAVAVMGAVEQLNLMIGGVFQAHADVAGIKAFPPESVFLTATFLIAAGVLLRGRGRKRDIVKRF